MEHPSGMSGQRFNPIIPSQEKSLSTLLDKHGLGDMKNEIIQISQNSIRFQIVSGREDVIGESRFGGLPDVLPDWKWPNPQFEFLAQINMEDFTHFDHNRVLPARGLLSFFARSYAYTWDSDEPNWLVMFYDGKTNLLKSAQVPEGFEILSENNYYHADLSVYVPVSVTPYPYNVVSLPDSEVLYHKGYNWEMIEKISDLQDDLIELVKNELGYSAWNRHQLLGSVGDDWSLLLSIYNNEQMHMNFGDCGQCHFSIRQEDLVARRFDRCELSTFNS
jgi:uncharacterized protein YwqG